MSKIGRKSQQEVQPVCRLHERLACRGMRESATQQFRAIGAAHSPDRRPDKT